MRKSYALIVMSVMAVFMSVLAYFYWPVIQLNKVVANVWDHVILTSEHVSTPYSDDMNIEMIDNHVYRITSDNVGTFSIYQKWLFIPVKREITFEKPELELSSQTVNVGSPLIINIKGTSSPSYVHDTDAYSFIQHDNGFEVIPVKEGEFTAEIEINGQNVPFIFTVDNPNVTFDVVAEYEATEIVVSGVTSDWQIYTDNKNICEIRIEDDKYYVYGITAGETNIILHANNEDIKFPIVVEKHEHVWEHEEVLPTCIEDGYVKDFCFCGEEQITETIGMLGHDLEPNVVSPTCLEDGYEQDICSRCGAELNYQVLTRIDHEAGQWKTIRTSSPINDGLDVKKCVYCDKVIEERTFVFRDRVINEKSYRSNMYGRLSIPSVGVNVALFNSSSQYVCDQVDSACYFKYYYVMLIGDHNHQGFEAIKNCSIGTTAYIDNGDEVRTYVCEAIYRNGRNTGHELFLDYDNPVENVGLEYSGKLVMYTCNSTPNSVTIVIWQEQ